MDIIKVRGLTDNELLVELATARRHLYDLRFQLATRQLTDYNQIAQTRKTIARLLTVQTERGITLNSAEETRVAAAVAGGKR
jgi:large subunit ribosomal protein L29